MTSEWAVSWDDDDEDLCIMRNCWKPATHRARWIPNENCIHTVKLYCTEHAKVIAGRVATHNGNLRCGLTGCGEGARLQFVSMEKL